MKLSPQPAKMKYKFDDLIDGQSVINRYPDLEQHVAVFLNERGLPSGIDAEFAMRYFILLYSPGSPGIDIYPSLAKRKEWALREMGVEKDPVRDSFPSHINELCLNKNHELRKKCILFLRLQQPEEWAVLCHAEESLYTLLEKQLPEEPQALKNHLSNIDMLKNSISGLKKKLTANESSITLENEIMYYTAQDNLGIRPEEYLVRIPKAVMPSETNINRFYEGIDS